MFLPPLVFNIVLEILIAAIIIYKNNRIQLEAKFKTVTVCKDDIIISIENPTDTSKKLSELIYELGKFQNTKVIYKNLWHLYTNNKISERN